MLLNVALLPLLCQGSKWLNGKSIWLVFIWSWVWITAGSQIFPPWIYFSLSQQKHHSLHHARCSKVKTHVAIPQTDHCEGSPSSCVPRALPISRKEVNIWLRWSNLSTTECMQARNRCSYFDLRRQTGSPNTNPNFLNFLRYYVLTTEQNDTCGSLR